MDTALAIVSIILILTGFLGSVLPVLPGAPLSWSGLLVLHFSKYADFSFTFLAGSFGIMVVITALDYFIPLWGTKKFGGTRGGVIGSGIGVVIGLFFLPIGIIAGPFLGALIGELLQNPNESKKALRSATGSFVGFLLGTGFKLAFCGWTLWQFFKAVT
ncbi:MAG: DUF456 domain-containing protein [Cryomorphaceae bacterium]